MLTFDDLTRFLSKTYGVSCADLGPSTDAAAAFGIDSLGLVTLGDKIEVEYGVVLPAEDLVECRTIGDFYRLVTTLMDATGARNAS